MEVKTLPTHDVRAMDLKLAGSEGLTMADCLVYHPLLPGLKDCLRDPAGIVQFK